MGMSLGISRLVLSWQKASFSLTLGDGAIICPWDPFRSMAGQKHIEKSQLDLIYICNIAGHLKARKLAWLRASARGRRSRGKKIAFKTSGYHSSNSEYISTKRFIFPVLVTDFLYIFKMLLKGWTLLFSSNNTIIFHYCTYCKGVSCYI